MEKFFWIKTEAVIVSQDLEIPPHTHFLRKRICSGYFLKKAMQKLLLERAHARSQWDSTPSLAQVWDA